MTEAALTQGYACSRCGTGGETEWDSAKAKAEGQGLDLVCDACFRRAMRRVAAPAAPRPKPGELYFCVLCDRICLCTWTEDELMAAARALFPPEHLDRPIAPACTECHAAALEWAAENAPDCLLAEVAA